MTDDQLEAAASAARLHRHETPRERALRVLRETLPPIRSHDRALDCLYTSNNGLFGVAAALYILAEEAER